VAHFTVHRPPYVWVQEVISIFSEHWEYLDGRYLVRGVDLLDLIDKYDNDPERVFNLLDSIVTDFIVETSEVQVRKTMRDRLHYLRKTGTIDEGWSNDEDHRQPDRERYPEPIIPTDTGYPGLEPPVG